MIHDPDIVVTGYHFRCYPKTRRKKHFPVWLEPLGTVVFIEVPVTGILNLLFLYGVRRSNIKFCIYV